MCGWDYYITAETVIVTSIGYMQNEGESFARGNRASNLLLDILQIAFLNSSSEPRILVAQYLSLVERYHGDIIAGCLNEERLIASLKNAVGFWGPLRNCGKLRIRFCLSTKFCAF